MRKWVAGALIGCLALSFVALALWSMDRGNKTSYFEYLRDYVVADGIRGHTEKTDARDFLDTHHDLYLAEGDAACDWLATRPKVPDIVPDGSADSETLARQYVHHSAAPTDWIAGTEMRVWIDRAAWVTLCSNLGSSRTAMPFNPDENPESDGD